jgi:putative colanic acid biosynthesis glycosyltransferase
MSNMFDKIPFFSIITVVCNDIEGLKKTAESVIEQNSKDYEWIVIDGGSTDGCISFLESLKISSLQWISESDHGIYEAMNKGIHRAIGSYVVFLNAGDYFPDDTILGSVKNLLMNAAQSVDVLFGGAMLLLPSGKSIYRAPKVLSSYIWHGLPGIHQATYYRNDVLNRAGYDESYQITGDYYLIAKLYTLGISSIVFNKSLVHFRVGDTSYRKPLSLIMEAHRVQRDVLKLGPGKRLLSACRKVLVWAALFLLMRDLIPESVIRMTSLRNIQ